MNYTVTNHHNFWQREPGNCEIQDADVVFMWNDFVFASQVRALQSMGKKVVVWEHGFGALSDYVLNNRPILANGYLAIGEETAKLVPNSLVVGNPVYDNVKKKKGKTGRALYAALHWVHGTTNYNNIVFQQLRDTYDEFEWDIKLSDKATAQVPESEEYGVWYSGVDGERSLPRIKNRIREYDAVFTPKAGTLDTFARLAGVPVYVIDEECTFRNENDPLTFKIEDDKYIKIGDKLEPVEVNMNKYIKRPSVSMDVILDWVKTL